MKIHLEELKLHYNQLPELPQSICQINEEIWSQGANEINNFITLQQNFFCFNLPGCISSHEQVDEIIGEQDCYGSDIQVLSDLMRRLSVLAVVKCRFSPVAPMFGSADAPCP